MNVAVIVPAAGSGRRFGGPRNKIFELLSGKAIFLRTLALFAGRADVCQIQMVVSAADEQVLLEQFGPELSRLGVTLTLGGATRSESVRNALARLSDRADLVCVHDAVRPCVSPAWIDAVFSEAGRSGGAILAYPVHGTLKRVDAGGAISQTVSREGLWEAQTPQVFARDELVRAYQTDVSAVTDDAQLMEQLGRRVSVVMGDPRNIKITTAADLQLAEAVIGTIR